MTDYGAWVDRLGNTRPTPASFSRSCWADGRSEPVDGLTSGLRGSVKFISETKRGEHVFGRC